MARFDYLEPHTLKQARSMLQRYGDQARIVAGCTDFLVRWRTGVWTPQYVVNLQHVPGLGRISYSARNGLRLGPLVTVQALERHPAVREHYAALATGATSFAAVQIRNLATVGGNVCNASPAGDTLPALLAFDAQCKIVGAESERWLPLGQFFKGPGRTALQPGEILGELRLPPTPKNSGSLYVKHSPRGAMDISAVGVAAAVSLRDRGKVIDDVKIALGAVAPTPIRAYGAEDMLRGQTVTPELIRAAAQAAQALATPIDDVRATGAYRKTVVGVLVQRTLEKSIEMAQGGQVPFEVQRRLAIQTAF
ncbi:MAG TPA: xanthine dehydrogenase family protein subunit M [Dehalococcoidia bacterium]|nr:xanthine dehydrogenase family protein subunit M [Dehalococcoidia bacterium]